MVRNIYDIVLNRKEKLNMKKHEKKEVQKLYEIVNYQKRIIDFLSIDSKPTTGNNISSGANVQGTTSDVVAELDFRSLQAKERKDQQTLDYIKLQQQVIFLTKRVEDCETEYDDLNKRFSKELKRERIRSDKKYDKLNLRQDKNCRAVKDMKTVIIKLCRFYFKHSDIDSLKDILKMLNHCKKLSEISQENPKFLSDKDYHGL